MRRLALPLSWMDDRRRCRALACTVLVTVCASCVTYEVPADDGVVLAELAQPVTVPLQGSVTGASGSQDLAALDAYYGSVLVQLQDAFTDRDPEQIMTLLAVHDRPFAPQWAKERMRQFRAIAQSLDFELHATRGARLEIEGATPAIGEVVPLVLRVPPSPIVGIGIPGRDRSATPARVLIAVVVTDHDCFGGRTERRFSEILPVEDTVRFADRKEWRLSFGLPEMPAEGCRRAVDIRCDLLPGALLVDDEVVPNQGARLAQRTFEFFPRGIESVLENPYTHLRNGLELADPKHFANVFLAAQAMPADFRTDATRLLIEGLRNGRADVQRLCMASLRELTGESLSVEDRDGWLAWWQAR